MMNGNATGGIKKGLAYAAHAAQAQSLPLHDIEQQCLRILRCTARAMFFTPGGLRFSPGARPWLDGLIPSQPGNHAGDGGGEGGGKGGVSPAVSD